VKQRMDMILKKITVGAMETNCYIFGDKNEVVIIDPGSDYNKIKNCIDRFSLKPKAIINTHGHMDHIAANNNFDLPVWIHQLDAGFLVDPKKNLSGAFGIGMKTQPAGRLLKDGDILKIGELDLEVIHTPGHTPGSISLKHNGLIFTGDTLFREGIGRTDFPYGSQAAIMKSINERLLIHNNVDIHPGHGPSSSMEWEKNNNPYF